MCYSADDEIADDGNAKYTGDNGVNGCSINDAHIGYVKFTVNSRNGLRTLKRFVDVTRNGLCTLFSLKTGYMVSKRYVLCVKDNLFPKKLDAMGCVGYF